MADSNKRQLQVDRSVIRKAYRQGRLTAAEISQLQEAGFKFEVKKERAVICVETGQVFESINAAARCCGLKKGSTIIKAIKTGGFSGGHHWYYADKPMPPKGYFKKSKERPVVCVKTGQVFKNLIEAATWSGVSSATIRQAIITGTLAGGYHWWWADEPMPPKEFFKKRIKHPVLCVETDKVFESMTEAAAWYGVNSANIYRALKNGTLAGGYHWWYVDEPLPPEGYFKKALKRAVICVETGRVFESIKEAAKWCGVACIQQALKKGTLAGGYHWCYADEPMPLDDFFKKPLKRPVKCVETGEEFESVAAAARWVGVGAGGTSQALKNGTISGGYHWEYV